MKVTMSTPNPGAKSRIQPQIFTDPVKILTRSTLDKKTWTNYAKQIGMYLLLKYKVKSRGPTLRVCNTCQDPVGVKKFEFLRSFSKATEHKV